MYLREIGSEDVDWIELDYNFIQHEASPVLCMVLLSYS